MSTRIRTKVFAAIALASLAALAYWLLSPGQPRPAQAPAARPPATLEFMPQEIVQVEPVVLRQVLPLSGSLRAIDMATVRAKVAGDVREVLVREGEPVRSGQVLVRMDATEYAARVAQSRGNLNNALAQLAVAARTRENNLALVEKGFISRNALDTSSSQYEAARATVEAAQGALDLVTKSLNDTVLRAPITGLVSARHVQPGEKVPVDGKLLEIVNLQTLELEAAVPASDIGKVAIGQPVTLRVEGQSTPFEGKVVRINPAAQAGSRSVPVYVQLANPQNQLRVGMFAEAQLVLDSRAGVIALPQAAVRQDSGGNHVFVIDNGKIARHPVTVGGVGLTGDERRVEIVSALPQGAQVIRTDMGNLQPGTPVRIAPAAAGRQ